MKRIIFSTIIMLVTFSAWAQYSKPLQNVYYRNKTSLNGKWAYLMDPYETGYYTYRLTPWDEQDINWRREAYFMNTQPTDKSDRIEYNYASAPTLNVPGDFNSQKPELLWYEGTVWYYKAFNAQPQANKRYFIHFEGANYRTDVYLNGKKLGYHIGGFTPFSFEVTQFLVNGQNQLNVKVDNKRDIAGVPTINTDWWNYGGLTRSVWLLETPETFIADYQIGLNKSDPKTIEGWVKLEGSKLQTDVNISIRELGKSITIKPDANGYAKFMVRPKSMVYWQPEAPKLYDLELSTVFEKINDRVAFRTVEVKGADILVNGKSTFLRGICIHEENPLKQGRANSKEDANLLLGWAKELNCNFVRLAHYPHNEHMVRVAEEMGIMVWEELPVYWTIRFENKSTYELAEKQLVEMIERDRNRASIIVWSMANETPVSEVRTQFLTNLANKTRSIDNSRLVSAALERESPADKPFHQHINDPFKATSDILSCNVYVGWYYKLPADCQKVTWDLPADKPFLVSEFGGGALYGFRADTLTRWSEDYQASLYRQKLAMLAKQPTLRGITPWILTDFRSPKRAHTVYQNYYNRKGVLSSEGNRKQAFYVLRDFYAQLKANGK